MIFIIGVLSGVFFNLCIYRLPRREALFRGVNLRDYMLFRSPKTSASTVAWKDDEALVVSGRRHMLSESGIGWQNLIVELLSCVIFVLLFLRFGFSFYFIYYAFLSGILIIAAFIDQRHKIIPNKLVIAGLAGAAVMNVAFCVYSRDVGVLVASLLGCCAGFLPLFLVMVITRGGMSAGDVKYMAAIGAFVGVKMIFVVLFLSVVLGGIVGVFLILFRKMSGRGELPFGPYISLASFIVIFFGGSIEMFLAVYYHVPM